MQSRLTVNVNRATMPPSGATPHRFGGPMTTATTSGLENVTAATTRLSHVDGERGELIVAGFPIEELAPHATSEQVAHLLWHDELPQGAPLASLRADLAAARELPAATLDLLAAAARVAPMDALRMGVAALSLA